MACNLEPTTNEQELKVGNGCPVKYFADLNLPEKLLTGLDKEGVEQLTDSQIKLLAAWDAGHNVLFEDSSERVRQHILCLAILKTLNASCHHCQSVILTSTKDKAVSIQKILSSFGVHMGVKSYVVIGGESIKDDIANLQAGFHVVLGTPGRIYDVIVRKILDTNHLTSFAIENLNDLLGSKSGQQVLNAFGLVSITYQLILLSSVMHKTLIKEAKKISKSLPTIIEGERLVNVEHIYFDVPNADVKMAALLSYLEKKKCYPTVIFCNFWRRVDYLKKNLKGLDFCFVPIHSRMSPKEQQKNLSKFLGGSALALIASVDLATSVMNSNTHTVIHFDAPKAVDDYMQRFACICPKISLSIVTPDEKQVLLDVGKEYCLSMCESSL